MNAKVLGLVDRVRQGYVIFRIEDRPQGGVRILLRRGAERATLGFEHFELPAVLQECSCIGLAK